MAVKSVCDGQCDTVTIANVLNVIREVEVRQHVVAQAHDALKYNGKAFFQIHEGKHAYRRSGIGRITRNGWQNNLSTKEYIADVASSFGQVTVRGQFIIGHKVRSSKQAMYARGTGNCADQGA